MIRPMTSDDAEEIITVVVAVGMFSPDESWVVRELLEHYGDGHVCVVDEEGGRVVGVAYYQPKGPADRVWDLTMIAVLPERQGGGRGSALLGHVENDLAERDQRLLVIDTSGTTQYDRTRDFYRRRGYTAEARVRDYWSDGDDLVVFVKRLAPRS